VKRILTVLLALCLVLPAFGSISFAGELIKWEDGYNISGNNINDFIPYKDYRTEQNPPMFMWPYIAMADEYEIRVARDAEMKDIAYTAKCNVTSYSFTETFVPGMYWWQVRFKSGKDLSEWTEPSRFLLLEDAYELVLPSIEEIKERFSNKSRPRYMFTSDNIGYYRELIKGAGKKYFDEVKASVDANRENLSVTEQNSNTVGNMVVDCAFIYILTGDKKYGTDARDLALEMASWDIDGYTSWDKEDRVGSYLMRSVATTYDWCHDLLSEADKKLMLKSIRERMIEIEHPTDGINDAPYILERNMYGSHATGHTANVLLASIITLGEIPESEVFLDKYLPMLVNRYPWLAHEDGGWYQGNGYFHWGGPGFHNVLLMMDSIGVDMRNKPYFKNLMYWYLYTFNLRTTAPFGDEGYGNAPDTDFKDTLFRAVGYTGNPYMRYLLDKLGFAYYPDFYMLFYAPPAEQVKPEMPTHLPLSHYFKDCGITAMYSDLINEDSKVTAWFRSDKIYGGVSHAHTDQNAFYISAYGENMVIDSGYNDAYWSDYVKGYARKAYAHNMLTYDGGEGVPGTGQKTRGKTTDFLDHPNFSLAVGDAVEAYNLIDMPGNYGAVTERDRFDKMERMFLYVRPDTFIVIDNIIPNEGDTHKYEFWLNAFEDISLYDSGTGARITKGKAALDAKVHYPAVEGYYSDIWSGPDLKPAPSPNDSTATRQVHKRVWFETPEAEKQRIVTTMNVHKKDEPAKYVYSDVKDGVMTLSFEDGTRVYIRLSEDAAAIDTGIYTTDAEVLTVKDDTLMAVHGSFVNKNGEEFIKAGSKISFTWGDGYLGFSSMTDSNISVVCDEVYKIKTSMGKELAKDKTIDANTWKYENGKLAVDFMCGEYTYLLNEKAVPGAAAEDATIYVNVDGAEVPVELTGYMNHYDEATYTGTVETRGGFYRIDEVKNVNVLNNSKVGEISFLPKKIGFLATGKEDVRLKLTSLSKGTYFGIDSDFETLFPQVTILAEGEDSYENNMPGTSKYNSNNAKPKGGVIQLPAITEGYAKWEIEVKEEGYYDLGMRYAAWGAESYKKVLQIDDDKYFNLDSTAFGGIGRNPQDWSHPKFDLNVYLTPGKHDITLWGVEGMANFDWLGFIKR